ncbi:MAG: hypothetical protein LBU65_11040 [Planctomycetaceae bacterium]|nr:hypothetical protein [Planctomycetaceae bacterium]
MTAADSFEQSAATAKARQKLLLVYFSLDEGSTLQQKDVPQSEIITAGGTAKRGSVRQVNYYGNNKSYVITANLAPIQSQRFIDKLPTVCQKFDSEILSSDTSKKLLGDYVLCRLTTDSPRFSEEQFAEMCGLPGIAIIDYRDKDAAYYGEVVSVFPFLDGEPYTQDEFNTILTLPAGTLTQRTIIYAVRNHAENPASANSEISPLVIKEASGHAEYMARTKVQGHQNFDARFKRIAAEMGTYEVSEVCAESWRGEPLLQAAIGCVRAWRTSPGHWRGVSAENKFYGYDIKHSENGTWYATGIFVK